MKKAIIWGVFASISVVTASQAQAENIYQLDPVNITAFSYEKKDLDTPADVIVISQEALIRTGQKNTAQALKFVPGVMMTQMGPHDQSWITGNTTVSLRGISGGTLVLLDGIPVNWNGVSHLDMIPVSSVEKVEIVKGGGAVLYGSSAYGGVINVITNKKTVNQASVGFGNDGQRYGNVSAGNDKFGVFYVYDHLNGTGPMTAATMGSKTVNGTTYRYNTGFGASKKQSAGFRYQINDRVSASYMYTQKDYSIKYIADQADSIGEIQHFDYKDKEHFLNLRYAFEGLEATAFYQQRDIDNPDYYVYNPSFREWETSRQRFYGMDVKNRWELGNDTALLGVLYKRETYLDQNQKFKNSNTGTLKDPVRFGTYISDNAALYGSYSHDFGRDLQGIASFRWDTYHTDKGDFDAFLPQFQLNKKVSESDSVYLNMGKSFRMPNMRQLYYSSGMLAANPNLDPEHGVNLEAGYKHIDGGNTWKAALFKVNLKDMISSRTITVDGSSVSQAYNASKYKNQGVEISFSRQANEKISWYIGGIYGNPQKKNTETSPWVKTFSRWQLASGLSWKGEKDEAAVNLSWTGDRESTTSAVSDIGLMLNSSLHYTHSFNPKLSASLDISNIFDRKDITDSGYYTEGRTYFVSMQYKL